MTRAKGRKIRAILIAEAMAEDAQAVGQAAEDTEGIAAAWEAVKVMKSGRGCMNSSVRLQRCPSL